MIDPEYRDFVQTVIDNIKANGFPEKKVAFPIEALYESAESKELNFNKVLEYLDEIQIAHVKTPEKIIFYAKDRNPDPVEHAGGGDPAVLGGMDPSQMMAAAAQMLQNMSPEQLKQAQEMYGNLTDEQRAELIEQAKKMGLLGDPE